MARVAQWNEEHDPVSPLSDTTISSPSDDSVTPESTQSTHEQQSNALSTALVYISNANEAVREQCVHLQQENARLNACNEQLRAELQDARTAHPSLRHIERLVLELNQAVQQRVGPNRLPFTNGHGGWIPNAVIKTESGSQSEFMMGNCAQPSGFESSGVDFLQYGLPYDAEQGSHCSEYCAYCRDENYDRESGSMKRPRYE